MKVIIENIGVFKYAEYELKDLTIICGKNNTGKTYATYCLYGFLDYFRNGYVMSVPSTSVKNLLTDGVVSINLNKTQEFIDTCLNDACTKYLQFLPKIFAAQPKYFEESKVSIKLGIDEINIPKVFERSYRTNKQEILQIVKPKDKNELLISLLKDKDSVNISLRLTLSRIIGDALKEIFFASIFKECFIASAERTGAVIFKDELNVQKNTLLREMAHAEDDINVEDILNKIYNTSYALPVRRNIDFIRNLDSISKLDSELYKTHPNIIREFQNIVGGTYKVSKEGLYFIPNSKTAKLTIGESASSVRSMLDIYFYIRHIAKAGQLLMIDEPELNLHPECQRLFARLLAKLVNCGIQVFITTHSDYIVKELNTLLMFNHRKKIDRASALMAKFGYKTNELLSTSQVGMYISKQDYLLLHGNQRKTKTQTLIPAIINSDYGIEAISFDDTINEMNRIQESLMFIGNGHKNA